MTRPTWLGRVASAKSAKLPASAPASTVSAALASERYAVLDHFLVVNASTGRHIGVASRRSLQKALGHVPDQKHGDFHKTCTRIKEDVSAHPVLGRVLKPRPPSSTCDCDENDDDSDDDDDEEKQDPSQRSRTDVPHCTTIDVASLADRSPHTAAADAPMSMVFSLFSKLQLRCVVVIASNGTAAGDWPVSKSLRLTPSTPRCQHARRHTGTRPPDAALGDALGAAREGGGRA